MDLQPLKQHVSEVELMFIFSELAIFLGLNKLNVTTVQEETDFDYDITAYRWPDSSLIEPNGL